MKKITLSLCIGVAVLFACKQEAPKAVAVPPSAIKEMQQTATEIDKNIDNLHTYQGAIRDMLHSFEASFPKDTFTVKLRTQLSDLNKVEYSYNVWKKDFNINWDTLKVDKTFHATRGKSEITDVKNALTYNLESSKKLLLLLKERGIKVDNDPTMQSK